jgi:ABC-type lipopolysaccharide export system ATPase subunit
MTIDTTLLKQITEACEVRVGNIYPAKGGPNGEKGGTKFWLVVGLTQTGAHAVGLNDEGEIVSATSYLKSAFSSRPLLGKGTFEVKGATR